MLRLSILLVLWITIGLGYSEEIGCHVNRTTGIADCSNRNLTRIPRLPRYVTTLIFKNNILGEITKNTFVNISYPNLKLKTLDVTNNSITNISEDSFINLSQLRKLILNGNDVPVYFLKTAFRSLNERYFRYLAINNMSLQHVDEHFFENLNNTGVIHISMKINNFTSFNMSVFRPLRSLGYVDLSYNFISDLYLDSDVSVHTLNINNNKVSIIVGNKCPKIQTLYLKHNDVLYLNKEFLRLFPNLKIIDLSQNPVKKIYSNAFAYLNKLNTIRLSGMCGLKTIENNAFNNSNVKSISLNSNDLHFSKHRPISSGMFIGCNSLVHVDLSDNNMMKTSQKYLTKLFRPIYRRATRISLADCGLGMYPTALSSFDKLSHLDLTGNELTVLEKSYFPNNLIWISLKANDITSVAENSLPENVTEMKVNLAQNPFDCTCELLWFLDLFTRTRENDTFHQSSHLYKCASPSSEKNLNISTYAKQIGQQKCLLPMDTIITITLVLSFFIVVMFVGTVLYLYRWHLRYFLYTVRSNRLPRQSQDTEEYEFDAFIAYDNRDLSWILQHAIPQLENKEHLKLCIHQRDFQLGGLIADDIVHCVNSSRKFIILLSKHFTDSQWCRFELAVIQRQLRSQCNNILIVVKLGSIDHHQMSPSLFELLTMSDYIEWSDDPRASRPLWERLVHFIRKEPSPLQSFARSASYERSGFVDDNSGSKQTGLRPGSYNRVPSEPSPSHV